MSKNKLIHKNNYKVWALLALGYELLGNELRYASISDLDFQISDLTYTLSPKTIYKLVTDSSRFSMQKEDVNSDIISFS